MPMLLKDLIRDALEESGKKALAKQVHKAMASDKRELWVLQDGFAYTGVYRSHSLDKRIILSTRREFIKQG